MTRDALKSLAGLLAKAGLLCLIFSTGCSQGSSAGSSGGSAGSATGQGGSAGAPPATVPVAGGGAAGSAIIGGTSGSAGNGGALGGTSDAGAGTAVAGATVSGGGTTAVSSDGAVGNSGSGGASASGGLGTTSGTADTGGVGNTGGAGRTGGTTPIGGTKPIGGITGTGGATVTGGTRATGGATTSGGATSTGGSASGVPVLVSTINLKGASGCPGLRLGDINGDGKMEIVVGQPSDQNVIGAGSGQIIVCVTAFDLKGNQLWQVGKPGQFHTASSDIPLQVYDLDGDGAAEVIAAMSTTTLTVLDGKTGTVKRTIKLPATGSNDCIAFANLSGKAWPQDMIVKDRYSNFWAIDSEGTLLWTHKGTTGHYPLVYDWDGDGKDEVMGGYDFLESDGKVQWSLNTTSHPALTMHADSIATGDMDGNPATGYEIVVNGNVAAAFDWKTGTQLWQDTHTIEAQQLGIGDYRPDVAGLEVVILDRLRTASEGFKSNNYLVDQHDNLLWKENRPTNSGWLTVTENMNNWDGSGSDFIFSYRRDAKSGGSGGTGTYLYDGTGKTVASFPYTGPSAQTFAEHADVCGDGKEEVLMYDEATLWIYANGGCNLDDPPSKPSQPSSTTYTTGASTRGGSLLT